MAQATFTLSPTEAESVAFRNRFIESKQWHHSVKLLLAGLAAIFLASSLSEPIHCVGITLGAVMAASALWKPFALRATIREMLRERPESLAETRMSFDAEKITLERVNGHISIRWSEFRRLTETLSCYSLHLDLFGMALIIPKRALTGSDAEGFLRSARTIPSKPIA
jgi:hypothetical protein